MEQRIQKLAPWFLAILNWVNYFISMDMELKSINPYHDSGTCHKSARVCLTILLHNLLFHLWDLLLSHVSFI